jgi:hypothetical protein
MTRIAWTSLKPIEIGVDRAVFYPATGPGVPWNGLTAANSSVNGSEQRSRYLDGLKIGSRKLRGEFSGSIEAYTYPDELFENVLAQQRADSFGLAYRTMAGDNYKLHLVYNISLAKTEHAYEQRNSDIFRWDFTTLPIPVPGASPSAHLIIDGNVAYPWVVEAMEDILYGSDEADPRLPLPQEIIDTFEENALLIVVDYGDGTFAVIGPDEAITITSPTTFQITWPSVTLLGPDNYRISTL